MRLIAACSIAACVLTAAPAQALPPISENPEIVTKLVEARGADRIRKACPDRISARIITAYSKARQLKSDARRMGYTEGQIDAFLDDRSAKSMIYDMAERWLASRGVTADPETACAAGRAEIARGSLAGSLLRER